MASQEQISIVERWFYDLFAKANFVVLDELVTPDFVSYGADGRVGAVGREAFKTWLQWYLSSFTDAEWTIHDIIAEGEKVAVRYSGLTTYRGGMFDIPSKNQRVHEMGMLLFRIVGGKVHELWSALCDMDLVIELGAFPISKER